MKIASLDAERDPHPRREERLKAAPPAPHQEMQQLMRQVHQNQNLRTEVVRRARNAGAGPSSTIGQLPNAVPLACARQKTMTDLPAVGHNIVAPSNVAERLESDFSALLAVAADEINAAEALPEIVENSTDMAEVAAVIVKLRDLAARSESHRKAEMAAWRGSGR
jgi:hypothetical protein